jgi:hypothetical protein
MRKRPAVIPAFRKIIRAMTLRMQEMVFLDRQDLGGSGV